MERYFCGLSHDKHDPNVPASKGSLYILHSRIVQEIGCKQELLSNITPPEIWPKKVIEYSGTRTRLLNLRAVPLGLTKVCHFTKNDISAVIKQQGLYCPTVSSQMIFEQGLGRTARLLQLYIAGCFGLRNYQDLQEFSRRFHHRGSKRRTRLQK